MGMGMAKKRRRVQKDSLADAFKSIMNKKLADEEALLDHFAQTAKATAGA